ncbi:hypothetical protein EDC04DRAFT_2599502 [Pisolithus marmoratus]|nr:hypothetical protein EDC04DRAFT_2599502 [Pisolithus marmoratus]
MTRTTRIVLAWSLFGLQLIPLPPPPRTCMMLPQTCSLFLRSMESNGVNFAVVEWLEGAVEKLLSGPPLLGVTATTDPTHYVQCFLTSGLGMPITTTEREAKDAQGSIALFFHENKDKCSNTSAKVFSISNCHMLHKKTTNGYKFKGAGAPCQLEIMDLEARPASEDLDEVVEDKLVVEAKQTDLAKLKTDISVLQNFYNDINGQWGNIPHQNIIHVNWPPKISIDIKENIINLGTLV